VSLYARLSVLQLSHPIVTIQYPTQQRYVSQRARETMRVPPLLPTPDVSPPP